MWVHTVYPNKYAHGFCFAVLCCGYTLTDFPISIRLTSLALWQSNDCPSASKATLMDMDKYFMWIHYERLHNHNKAKHNKTVCIFLGIYCSYQLHFPRHTMASLNHTLPQQWSVRYDESFGLLYIQRDRRVYDVFRRVTVNGMDGRQQQAIFSSLCLPLTLNHILVIRSTIFIDENMKKNPFTVPGMALFKLSPVYMAGCYASSKWYFVSNLRIDHVTPRPQSYIWLCRAQLRCWHSLNHPFNYNA